MILTKPLDAAILDQVSVVDGDRLAGLHPRDVADGSEESGGDLDGLVQGEHGGDHLVPGRDHAAV